MCSLGQLGLTVSRSFLLQQDPMSHRIIEKRRRDRMNNCLADLSRLIPAEYLKKGRGRVEKTEIIEMAIRHMKHLQGLRQGEFTRSTILLWFLKSNKKYREKDDKSRVAGLICAYICTIMYLKFRFRE